MGLQTERPISEGAYNQRKPVSKRAIAAHFDQNTFSFTDN